MTQLVDSNPFGSNPFQAFLEDPVFGQRATFFGRPEVRGAPPAQAQFFRREFANIQDQFLGALRQRIGTGVQPNLRFDPFLDEFDLNRYRMRQAPSFRGEGITRFAPRTRSFLF